MGMSNGGMMSERLGCERPDLFRAIASVTGATVERPTGSTWINSSLSLSACDSFYAAATAKQGRAFSVLHVHGTADPTVQWNGGGQLDWPTVPNNMAAWAHRLGCNNATVQQTLNTGNFSNQLWSDCAYLGGQVELVKVEGGQHVWFTVPSTFNATDYALAFFQRLPPGGGDDDSGSHAGTVVAVVLLLLVLAAAVVGGVVLYRRKKERETSTANGREADVPTLSSSATTRPAGQYQQRLLD